MSEASPMSILIVDDYDVYRKSLRLFLEQVKDIVIVGEASNGYQAIDFCLANPPDLVLMDIMMPGLDGISATKVIREKCPTTQVIALTAVQLDDMHRDVLEAGALFCVDKGASLRRLPAIIDQVRDSSGTINRGSNGTGNLPLLQD